MGYDSFLNQFFEIFLELNPFCVDPDPYSSYLNPDPY